MTNEEFFINAEVKARIEKSPDVYIQNQTLAYDQESCPELFYCTETIEDFEKLAFHLRHSERLQEFAVNAFYYYWIQADNYESHGIESATAKEIARTDVYELYKAYNEVVD